MTDNHAVAANTQQARTPLTGLRRRASLAYQWVLLIFLLLGVFQIFLAGVGVFSLHGAEVGAPGETAFNPHRSLGFALGGVALIILILALVARRSTRSMILAAVFVLAGIPGAELPRRPWREQCLLWWPART